MKTVEFKIYGGDGHRHNDSFYKSYTHDLSYGKTPFIMEVLNSDKTGTTEYSIVRVIRKNFTECVRGFIAQLCDGWFAGTWVGHWELTMDCLSKDDLKKISSRKILNIVKNLLTVNSLAMVCKVKKVEGKNYYMAQISTRREWGDGCYYVDFPNYVIICGNASNIKLEEGDTFQVKKFSVSNSYDKEKNVTYFNFFINEIDNVKHRKEEIDTLPDEDEVLFH